MPSLVDTTYFIGELNITGTEKQPVRERLCYMISIREPEFLRYALGYEFYELFKAGVASNPIYQLLRDGGEYTLSNGNKQYWRGLANATLKESPIAGYVYYWWMRDSQTQSTTMGEAETKPDNAERRNNGFKACRAFNAAISKCRDMWCMLTAAVDEDGSKLFSQFKADQVDTCQLQHINMHGI
ncbi:MAG TPA: hypothetical protein VIM64_11530 [Puia sp.]